MNISFPPNMISGFVVVFTKACANSAWMLFIFIFLHCSRYIQPLYFQEKSFLASGCSSSPSWYDHCPLPLLLTLKEKHIPVHYFMPVITSNFSIISPRHLVVANVIIRISFNQSPLLHLILQHPHGAKMKRIRYQIRGKFVNPQKVIFS